MPVIDCFNVEGTMIPKPFERLVKVIVDCDTDPVVKEISVTMGILAPHSQNDLHCHEGTELLYIATGRGNAVIGEEKIPIRENCLIIAPPGILHQQINESDETMRMLAVWTPAVSGREVLERAAAAARAGETEQAESGKFFA